MKIPKLAEDPNARQEAWLRLFRNDARLNILHKELTARYPEMTTEARLMIMLIDAHDRIEELTRLSLEQAMRAPLTFPVIPTPTEPATPGWPLPEGPTCQCGVVASEHCPQHGEH